MINIKINRLRGIFEARFEDVLDSAKEGELRCLSGKRWDGNAILIVVDAALDSIGLNYFKIVVPRVKRFHREYVKNEEISSFEHLSMLSTDDSRLRGIMNNERVWRVAIEVCKVLDKIKEEKDLKSKSDFDALRYWSENAKYEEWRNDEIGRINGVGLITFQYLRMQAGIDTSMPDKIIKRVVKREFSINTDAVDDLSFINEMERLSNAIGYSQILICWAIWLRESDMGKGEWEAL